MKRLSGGIDIGRYTHQLIILNEKEQVLYQRKLPHNLGEMKQTMKELKYLEKKEKAQLSLRRKNMKIIKKVYINIVNDTGDCCFFVTSLPIIL
jgi:activator of 2-hydroxyglutaryl-CoA dehydratase